MKKNDLFFILISLIASCSIQGMESASDSRELILFNQWLEAWERELPEAYDQCAIESETLNSAAQLPAQLSFDELSKFDDDQCEKSPNKSAKRVRIEVFTCNYPGCEYTADYQSTLISHQRRHTGEKPFVCNYPGCVFTTAHKDYLPLHKRTHTGEKLFKCNYLGCEYTAAYKHHLIRHQRTHTREKPFKCDHFGCEYAVARKDNLISHQRIHTGEKPFKCDYLGCEYKAARKNHLTRHQRIHRK